MTRPQARPAADARAAEEAALAARMQLADWFHSRRGRLLLNRERAVIDDTLFALFGYHIVQVGAVAGVDLMRNSRVMNHYLVDADPAAVGLGAGRTTSHLPEACNDAEGASAVRGAPRDPVAAPAPSTELVAAGPGPAAPAPLRRVHAGFSALPFDSDSVDVVLLPHVLEFVTRPHEALREAARILVPDGHLIVCAFNPLSLLGAARYLLRRRRRAPWSGRFLTTWKADDWLGLLGLETLEIRPLCFGIPLRNGRLDAEPLVRNGLVRRTVPYLAGAYVIVARKQVSNVTPVRTPPLVRRRLIDVPLAHPSVRAADRRGEHDHRGER